METKIAISPQETFLKDMTIDLEIKFKEKQCPIDLTSSNKFAGVERDKRILSYLLFSFFINIYEFVLIIILKK